MMGNYKRKVGNIDPTKIIIAVEGAKREKQYFDWFTNENSQVRVIVLAPENIEDEDGNRIDDVGKVKPNEILDRLIRFAEKPESNILSDDQIFFVFDADKFKEYHKIEEFVESVQTSKSLKANTREYALSLPCFEFWLLLHIAEYQKGQSWKNCEELKLHLGAASPAGFNSAKHIDKASIEKAIAQAKEIDKNNSSIQPKDPGTKVYLLVEKLLAFISKHKN